MGTKSHIPFRLFIEGVDDSEIVDFKVQTYCIPDGRGPIPRINPIVTHENGVSYSVMSEVRYEIFAGNGLIFKDGSYDVLSGDALIVDAFYKDQYIQFVAEKCID